MEPNQQPDQPDAQANPSGAQPPYPGFGSRHDIFYQYKAPEQGAVPASSMPPPPPLRQAEPQYPAQLPTDEFDEEPETAGHKRLIIGSVVVLTIIVIGVLALLLGHHSAPKGGTNTPGTSQVNPHPDLVDTPCYSFTLPKPHDQLSTTITSCSGSYLSGTDKQAGVTVAPIIIPASATSDLVTSWKSSNPTYKIVSENPATFGTYQAYQIMWNPADNASETDMSILVYIPATNGVGRYTSEQGASIFGFEIYGRYDSQSSSKAAFDSILNSWTWK